MEKILSLIKKDEVADLALELGNVESPAGYELKAAEYVYAWLEENGLEGQMMKVMDDRYNAVGRLRGKGGGLSLLFNSHLDSVYGHIDEQYKWNIGKIGPRELEVRRKGNSLHGMAVVNNRGPMAAFLIAAKAIKESGEKLKGDLILTSVVGEIERARVDEFQGGELVGTGLGSRHLVHDGISADYALVAEATNYAVTWVEAGVVWFKISVHGARTYTPYVDNSLPAKDSDNAIVKMAPLILALQAWAAKYEKKHQYKFSGGTVIPKVNIGAIRGGLPFRINNSTGLCSIYVDVRLLPGEGWLHVRDEITSIFRKVGIDADIEAYHYNRGWEGRNVDGLLEAITTAHRKIFKSKLNKLIAPVTSMSRDINVFNEAGIPAITYGPPVEGYSSMKIEDLYNTAKLYALIAIDICNRPSNKS